MREVEEREGQTDRTARGQEKQLGSTSLALAVFDLHLVCVSPYRPAACGKAALRGLTHDRTRSSPAPSRYLLHRRGHPHMTLRASSQPPRHGGPKKQTGSIFPTLD